MKIIDTELCDRVLYNPLSSLLSYAQLGRATEVHK